MLIKFFKKSYIFQYLLLLVFTILLWINNIIQPIHSIELESTSPLFNLIYLVFGGSLLLRYIIPIYLLLSGLFLNSLLSDHGIIIKNSKLSALTFILLTALIPEISNSLPALFSIPFIIVALKIMLEMYESDDHLRSSFKAGFYISIASLFYFPAVFLIIFIWAILFLYRTLNFRNIIIPILAFLTPYLFLFTYYFLFDQHIELLNDYGVFFSNFMINIPTISLFSRIIVAIFGLFLLSGYLKLLSSANKKSIQLRKKLFVISNLLIYSCFSLIFSNGMITESLIILLPSSIILATMFSEVKKIFWLDLFFSLFAIAIIINRLNLI